MVVLLLSPGKVLAGAALKRNLAMFCFLCVVFLQATEHFARVLNRQRGQGGSAVATCCSVLCFLQSFTIGALHARELTQCPPSARPVPAPVPATVPAQCPPTNNGVLWICILRKQGMYMHILSLLKTQLHETPLFVGGHWAGTVAGTGAGTGRALGGHRRNPKRWSLVDHGRAAHMFQGAPGMNKHK